MSPLPQPHNYAAASWSAVVWSTAFTPHDEIKAKADDENIITR